MRWILFGVAAPYAVLVGWGWGLLMVATGAARDLRYDRLGRLAATWRLWVRKVGWKWSTTIGFMTIYQPDHLDDPEIVVHEWIHTEQIEDLMMLGLLLGSVVFVGSGDAGLAFGIYLAGGVYQLPNFVTAGLRGADPYSGALHERHPYAEQDETTKP